MESDPIGLKAGVNTYSYTASHPVSRIDPFGLRDYTEQETLRLLQQAYDSSTAGRYAGWMNIYHNSKGNGPYDFGWNAATSNDTWTRCGLQMNADDFANYVAGFQGAAYDQEYFWTTGFIWAEVAVKSFGVGFHVTGNTKAKDDPFDRTGFPMINFGEKDGSTFHRQKPCGCDN